MRTRLKNFASLICALFVCAGITITAGATSIDDYAVNRASDYLNYYSAYALASSNGTVIIEFEVDGAGRMDLVGSSYVIVQEKSGSNWVGVSTYWGSSSNGMLGENTVSHIGKVTYSGTRGKEYRAIVTVYAENSTGDDSRTIITNSVTAK